MVEILDASTFYYVLRLDKDDFRLLMEHVNNKNMVPTNGDRLMRMARRIPLEIAPLHKTLCLHRKIIHFCLALVEKVQQLDRVVFSAPSLYLPPNLLEALPHPPAVGFELTFGLAGADSDTYEADKMLIDALQFISTDIPLWPICERLLISGHELELKLALVHANNLKSFIAEVRRLCSLNKDFTPCEDLKLHFQYFSIDLLLPVSSDEESFSSMRLHDLVSNFMETPISFTDMPASRNKFDLFITHNIRSAVTVSDCVVCLQPFVASAAPVEICPPKRDCPGHFVCLDCAEKMYLDSQEYKCPICRGHAQLNVAHSLDKIGLASPLTWSISFLGFFMLAAFLLFN